MLVLRPSLSTLAWLLLGERFANWPWKGRVPRFQEARLSPTGPVAVVTTRARGASTTGRSKGKPSAPHFRGGASVGGASTSRQPAVLAPEPLNRSLSWVEHCAPAHCERYGPLRTCLTGGGGGGGATGNATGTLPASARNGSGSGGGGGDPTSEGAGLEVCKKRHGGTYSWSKRLKKICEPSPRDQSVLNWCANSLAQRTASPP